MKILPRDNLSLHDYVKRHYYQHEVYKKLYDTGDFTDYELMYIFPNNVLRRLGFPIKHGKKKRRIINRKIYGWQLFNIIDETIDNVLCRAEIFTNSDWYNKFVSYEDIN